MLEFLKEHWIALTLLSPVFIWLLYEVDTAIEKLYIEVFSKKDQK